MSEITNQDTDFQAMEPEELKAFINGESAQPTEDSDIEETVSETSEEKSEEQETLAEETEEVVPETQGEEAEVPSDEDPKSKFYKGKSADDLIGIIENQNKFISRLGNDVSDLKKAKQLEQEEAEEQSLKSDLAEYEPKDVENIEKIVAKVLRGRDSAKKEAELKTLETSRQDNLQFYQDLQANSEVFNKVRPELEKRFKDEGESVVYKKGWIKQAALEALSNYNKVPSNANNDKLKKKKAAAQTVGQGGGKGSSGEESFLMLSPEQAASKLTSAQYRVYAEKRLGVKVLGKA